ncbi:carbohydrate ABC transporter permease [uncultured Microbacterium sp.]|uniref:carbohydrate ABC transporter permease n=1 Tax=uncultured Microbacterium sp. TaxID=191216 RepID=UPI0025F45083|nr:sugar ABC transporter permease [uncultured Microbacterium sp.]
MSHVTATEALITPKSAGARRGQRPVGRRSPLRAIGGWRSFLWVIPGLALIAVFVYYPLLQNIYLSFFQWSVFKPVPEFVGASNYLQAANDPIFWRSLFNNTAYAVASLIFQVAGALVLAALVETYVRKHGGILRAIYFIPSAISLTVAGLLFYFIYQPQTGLLNEFLRVVGLGQYAQAWLGQESSAIWAIIVMSQWQSFGYTTLLYSVAIQRIPRELYDAADLDGVGPLSRIWHITTPLVREMSTLLIIVTVTGAFQVFNEVMVMTAGGPNNSSQVLGTWLYHAGFINNEFGYAAAIATVVFVITTVLAVVQLWISRRRRVEW